MRPSLLLFVCAGLAAGQSATADRSKAADYPVSASAERADIGAEFLVHSIPSARGYYLAKTFLVVEAGVFPKGLPLKVSAGQFTLRLNGASQPLLAQSPGTVAASLKYPDWEMPRGFSASASAGNVGISTDRQPVGRFPDDRRAPVSNRDQDNDIDYQISLVEFPAAVTAEPAKGCLFFASDIKAKKIRSLELEWTGPAGERATLKLR